MDAVDAIAPLTEDVLRGMSKSIRKLVDGRGNDCQIPLDDLLALLIETASAPGLSDTHRVAACNTLCGVIDQCLFSKAHEVARVACSSAVCFGFFEVFIEQHAHARSRVMKQVLNTLTKLFSMLDRYPESISVRSELIERLMKMVFQNNDSAEAKPAMQALANFLSKEALRPEELFRAYSVTFDGGILSGALLSRVLSSILGWVSFPDVAATVGNLISALVFPKGKEPIEIALASRCGSCFTQLPIWMEPLRTTITKNPDRLQAIKTYIFPVLFSADLHLYWAFLRHLKLDQHMGIEGADAVCEQSSSSAEETTLILFSAMQTGKDLGIIQETDLRQNARLNSQAGVIEVPDIALARILTHSSTMIRLAGLDLLVRSYRSTKPFTMSTLKTLKQFLPHMHGDSDASFRSEFCSFILVLVSRLRAITCGLVKPANRALNYSGLDENILRSPMHGTRDDMDARTILNAHKQFVQWYLSFLEDELHPTAPYRQHMTALKVLTILAESGVDLSITKSQLSRGARGDVKWPFQITILQPALCRSLLDLLVNAYDDVRQMALSVLCLKAGHQFVSDAARSNVAFERAEQTMLRSGRADQADGFARVASLLAHSCMDGCSTTEYNSRIIAPASESQRSLGYLLESLVTSAAKSLAIAQSQLSIAVGEMPIHGYCIAIRYVLDLISRTKYSELDQLLWEVQRVIIKIWETVRFLLCNDAPEGYMPEDMEVTEELTSKDVLSYAWLAVKESSLLMRTIVACDLMPISVTDHGCDQTYFETFASFCFTQLAELRHRGAFSTVAQTFATICQRCGSANDPRTRAFVRDWYEQIIRLIQEKGSVTTRRSAGIPALMVAVLPVDEQAALFDRAVADLQRIARTQQSEDTLEGADLPQVHALNCLKAIFTAPKLADRSERCIVEVIKLAASALRSQAWAIRNCGLMLFRSLIDRLLGTTASVEDAFTPTSSTASRLSYKRYPGLLDVLAELLRDANISSNPTPAGETAKGESSSLTSEAIFPVLYLLRRAAPPESRREEFRKVVLLATSSPQWHIRDIAARTFAALTKPEECAKVIEEMNVDTQDQNACHGRLLIIKSLIRILLDYANHGESGLEADILQSITVLRAIDVNKFTCPVALSIFVDICSAFSEFVLEHESQSPRHDNKLACSTSLECLEIMKSIRQECRMVSRQIRTRFNALDEFQFPEPFQDPLLHRSLALHSCFCSIIFADRQEKYMPFARMQRNAIRSVADMLASITKKLGTASCQNLALMLCQDVSTELSYDTTCAIEQALTAVFDQLSANQYVLPDEALEHFAGLNLVERFGKELAPSQVEQTVAVWGLTVAAKRKAMHSWTAAILDEADVWLKTVQKLLDASTEFSTRNAAAYSLLRFMLASNDQSMLTDGIRESFLLVVYETLIDDDEEIRKIGSKIVTKFMNWSRARQHALLDLTPSMASQILCSYLTRKFPKSEKLAMTAISHLLGLKSTVDGLQFRSVAKSLKDATVEDDTLFAIEKQNLYVNDLHEANLWSRVLKQVHVSAVPRHILTEMSSWVVGGLASLTAAAASQHDGPLGWTATPEVFGLGMRVIVAADVLLMWRTRSRKVKASGSLIRMKLFELRRTGEESGLHEAWLKKIDQILAASVLRRLVAVETVLGGLQVDL